MEFFEKQFDEAEGFILVPTWITSLNQLIRSKIDLWNSFGIYQWQSIHQDDAPIVGHAGEYRNDLLAPILSDPDDPYTQDEGWRRVFMLDPDESEPKIIRVPNGIPLVGMRDSYRYHCTLNKFFTRQSVEQILEWLKCEGWKTYVYDKLGTWPMDFTSLTLLRKHLKETQ